MPGDSTHRSGMSFSAADAFVHLSDLLVTPGGMVSVGDNYVGGFPGLDRQDWR
jgi:hypothetical protein